MSEGNGNVPPAPRRALLGMPGYGEMTSGAARGLWRASAGPLARIPLDWAVAESQGSLLAQNFNVLWCQALNECHQGRPVHYFAMLHADVEPQDGWLDVLVEELEARNFDVLGAVVPIKHEKGLTSLALAHESGDPFRFKCRLTMQEVFRLPETFTSEDVGAPLLLNTGCWVCRFDEAWARQVFFTINDRIAFNTKTNQYQVVVESEDWFFSRLCHEMGLKIGATRKVRLNHAGKIRYTNAMPWGEDFDSQFVPASTLKPLTRGEGDPFLFPADVEGWLLQSEGRALADLATGKKVLEVGSYCGRSTVCMAQTADVVYSIDPHDGRATPRPKGTFDTLHDNLARYGLRNVKTMVGTLDEMADLLPDFDLVFIDGAHDYESVMSDIRHARTILAPDGLIAFHDYRNHPGQHDGGWDPGVTRAVDELVAEGGELLSTHATVAVVKPPPLLENAHAPDCNLSAR